jgi:hypothetical protein
MSFETLVGILVVICFFGFIAFCLRQGIKVKGAPEGLSRIDPVTLTMDPPDRPGL